MRLGLFRVLSIQTTTLCNLRCPTCLRQNDPTDPFKVQKGKTPLDVQMPDKMVYSIVDQAVDLGFRGQILFYGYNEPLLDPRFFTFARYAKAKGLKPGLFTNGVVLNSKNPRAEEIAGQIDETIISSLPAMIFTSTCRTRRSPPLRNGRLEQDTLQAFSNIVSFGLGLT